jgi:hypothetical protein
MRSAIRLPRASVKASPTPWRVSLAPGSTSLQPPEESLEEVNAFVFDLEL